MGIVEDLVDTICIVIEGHRGRFSEGEEAERNVRTCDKIRVDLLQSLLFLADELDITHERVDIDSKEKLDYDINNYIHFYKHYYTEAINIADNRGIKISFRYPKGRKDQCEIIVKKYVLSEIKASLDNINNVLNFKYGINIFLDEAEYNENSTIGIINIKIYEKIINKIFLPKSVISLKTINFSQMANCYDPELFYDGASRWEDIVNDLDIQRTQLSEIQKKSLELLDICCREQCQNLLLITGEAGSGKTTLLMRLAYNMFRDEKSKRLNLLWYDGSETYEAEKILNFYEANTLPIIIFVDTPNIYSLVENIHQSKPAIESRKVPILMIVTARQSEWDNASGADKVPTHQRHILPLVKLDDEEISSLLGKLEKHQKLGVLEKLTPQERLSKFKEYCERQLLVAMLEATRGDNFKSIIINEYENLKKAVPEAARAYEMVALFHMYFISTPKSL